MASFYLNYKERTIRAHKRRAEFFSISHFPHFLLTCNNPTLFYSLLNCSLTYFMVLLLMKSFLF